MMGIYASLLGGVFKWILSFMPDYGWSVILFTLLIRMILLPVNFVLYRYSSKAASMYPDIYEAKIKYYGNKERYNEEQLKIYKKNRYNPLIQLIPLIIQLVLLTGVLKVMYQPMQYIYGIPEEKIKDISMQLEVNSEQTLLYEIQTNEYEWEEDLQGYIYQIKKTDYRFFGLDLRLENDHSISHFVLMIFTCISSLLLSMAENRWNILQKIQSRQNQIILTGISVFLSMYLGYFVSGTIGLYWITGNLFAIFTEWLLHLIYPSHKYIDEERVRKIRQEYESLNHRTKQPFSLWIRSLRDYKKFYGIEGKHLVFYSESNGFYKYYAGMIDYILKYTNIPVHYITSDPEDDIFKDEHKQLHPYYIDSKRLIPLMMKMDADVVVMTMPDLDTYQIKRSYVKKDIEYINVCHGIGSYNMTFRKGAVDHFDTLFLAGKHQTEEIRMMEKIYHLPEKKIIEAGYPLLDQMRREYKGSNDGTIVIAPSWQKDNIMESCLDELLNELMKMNKKIIVRPHPQYARNHLDRITALKNQFKTNSFIEIQEDFTSNQEIMNADLLISDWSSIIYEYAFTTMKPVITINTPMKVMNPDYKDIDIIPFDIWARDVIGISLDMDEIKNIETIVNELKDAKYQKAIDNLMKEYIYNLDHSGQVSGKYIVKSVMEHNQKTDL